MNESNTYNNQVSPQMPMMPLSMIRRGKLGERFRGQMNTYLPNKMAQSAVIAYIIALLGISVVFNAYVMSWYWWLFGIVGVLGFFLMSSYLGKKWERTKSGVFERRVFWTGLGIRAIAVLILYWFFNEMTGQPFMFESADEKFYHEMGEWMANSIREGNWNDFWNWTKVNIELSDSGFPVYMGIVYYLTDDSIIVTRLLNCFWSALTCVLLYKLGRRNFGEPVGRMAAIFFMLEPHYIIYCGLHLKETLMVLLLVLFLERADSILRTKTFKIWEIFPIFAIMLSLYLFRTVLGVATTIGVTMALLFSSQKVANLGRRWLLLIAIVFGASLFVGGRIMSELESLWARRGDNQELRMNTIQQTQSYAKYASKTVLAPMIFTIPFPTMVETEKQENHRMLHAGYVVKNVMSFFCIAALVFLIINSKSNGWRNNVMLGAFLISYLLILVQSAFVHADRFHLPAYVVELLFAAYGVQQMTKAKYKRWFMYWCMLMIVAWFAWSWFKLAGRGL